MGVITSAGVVCLVVQTLHRSVEADGGLGVSPELPAPQSVLMKLVVEPKSDRVVGLHVVGPEAGEIVQGFAVAVKCGATKAQFDATIGIHPTAAEEFVTMREPVPEPEQQAAE